MSLEQWQQEERDGHSRSTKQQGCPESDVLWPQCVWSGRWGKRRDQVAGRGKLQRNQPKAPSVHKKGLKLHPVGSERQLMGLPFKYLQGHSEASESLSFEI